MSQRIGADFRVKRFSGVVLDINTGFEKRCLLFFLPVGYQRELARASTLYSRMTHPITTLPSVGLGFFPFKRIFAVSLMSWNIHEII